MVKWLIFPLQGNATSNRTAKNNAKCLKKHKTWSEEELTTFTHVLVSNEERDKTQTGVAKFSYSRSLHLGAIDPSHQKSSPNRRFLRQKNLLYMYSMAAVLLLVLNLNLLTVLFTLECTNLCSCFSSSMNLRRTTFQHLAVSSSILTNKLSDDLSVQTICSTSSVRRANICLGILPTLLVFG